MGSSPAAGSILVFAPAPAMGPHPPLSSIIRALSGRLTPDIPANSRAIPAWFQGLAVPGTPCPQILKSGKAAPHWQGSSAPPERIENKLNELAKIAGEEARATLSKAEQQTKTKIEDGLIDNIGIKLFQSAKGKEINVQAARLALTANASLAAENALSIRRKTTALNTMKRRTKNTATSEEIAVMSGMETNLKGLKRKQQNLANEKAGLNAFMLGLDGAKDLLELEKNYLRAISSDPKEQVSALVSTAGTIKRYVDMAKENRVDLQVGLNALAKTGISEAEFARFKSLSLQSDFLAAASGALNGIGSVGTAGLTAYNLYQDYEKSVPAPMKWNDQANTEKPKNTCLWLPRWRQNWPMSRLAICPRGSAN